MYPCVVCKGRRCKEYFGTDFCPLKAKLRAYVQNKEAAQRIKQEFTSRITSPFIGRNNYPNISAGLVNPLSSSTDLYDSPKKWAENKIPMEQVISMRMNVLNINDNSNVKLLSNENNVQILQHVALARNPANIDVSLKDKPKFFFNVQPGVAPFGGRAIYKKIGEAENIRLEKHAAKAYYDTDLKANEAVLYLAKKSLDEHKITGMLSTGTLGVKERRKLVPTRWSITATDDMLSKDLIEKVRHYDTYDYNLLFRGSYFGNTYYVMVLKRPFSYELFERYMPTNSVEHDVEYNRGRTKYAQETAGGYYAARLAIVEELERRKINGAAIAIRLIGKEYSVPLGVWVVRQAAREAMKSEPLEFENSELMFKYAIAHAKKYLENDVSDLIAVSDLREYFSKQKSINDFF